MVKKFLVLASETIIYREEIEADDEKDPLNMNITVGLNQSRTINQI